MTHRTLFCPTLLSIALLAGCGGNAIDTQPVNGRVTYKQKPVGNALVIFKPKSPTGRVASGFTRDDGSFTLATSGATSGGALEGEYEIRISKVIDVDDRGNPIVRKPEDLNPSAPQVRSKQKSVIPEKYDDPNKSLLDATVVKGNNDFQFDLSD